MIRRTLLMLIALALATAAACGGGDDDSDDSADDPPETSETTEAAADDTGDDTDTGDEGDTEAEGDDGAEGDEGAESDGTALDVDRTFSGEGSEPFCTQASDVMTASRGAGSDGAALSDAEFADQMAAMTPPDEIAEEWETLYTVQQAVADDPDGDIFATMDPDESEDWAMSGAIVAAYLSDVCEISDDG